MTYSAHEMETKMGVCGIKLSSSDTFADVYDAFYQKFNSCVDVDTIVNELEVMFSDVLSDDDEKNDFIFALAKAIWETGFVPNKYYEELLLIVNSKSELHRWIRLGGSISDSMKRHIEVERLLEKISIENVKPKRPRKKKLIDALFEKGECIALKDRNGYYSGVIILNSEKQTEYGINMILVIDYFSEKKPSLEDFTTANCAMEKDYKGVYRALILNCFAKNIKKLSADVERIGMIAVNKDYSVKKSDYGFGSWSYIPERMSKGNSNHDEIPRTKVKSLIRRSIFG